MNIFKLIVELIWLIRIIANMLSYIYLWYIKEYRLDRMLIHLKTRQGKRLLFITFRLPPLTPKTMGLFVGSLFSLGSSLLFLPGSWWGVFLLTDLLTFPIVSFWVILFKIPTFLYHQLRITQAIEKLRTHKPMVVVGITGSFGKTSTKEYLTQILSEHFKVIKSEASKNSPIGIAELVLKNLKPETECFVVEMGAYKKGEIAFMSKMVGPQIAVITAINAQHNDLFGSIENTKAAKYELVQGLTGQKLAIFNGDNPHTLLLSKQAKQDGCTVFMITKTKTSIPPWVDKMVIISDIKMEAQGITYKLTFAKEKLAVAAQVLGAHQSENITAAILAAVGAGMSFKSAVSRAAHITEIPKTMQKVKGIKEAIFINDTFNNNPDAARVAIEFLGQTPGKRILVFQPMIELGTYAEVSHIEAGKLASQNCDYVYLTNPNYFEAFSNGAKMGQRIFPVKVLSAARTATEIKSLLKKGDTVLFKGKEAEAVLKELNKST